MQETNGNGWSWQPVPLKCNNKREIYTQRTLDSRFCCQFLWNCCLMRFKAAILASQNSKIKYRFAVFALEENDDFSLNRWRLQTKRTKVLLLYNVYSNNTFFVGLIMPHHQNVLTKRELSGAAQEKWLSTSWLP